MITEHREEMALTVLEHETINILYITGVDNENDDDNSETSSVATDDTWSMSDSDTDSDDEYDNEGMELEPIQSFDDFTYLQKPIASFYIPPFLETPFLETREQKRQKIN